jgi:hypothetical protein
MGKKLTLQFFTDSVPGILVLYLFAAVWVDSMGVCWRKWRQLNKDGAGLITLPHLLIDMKIDLINMWINLHIKTIHILIRSTKVICILIKSICISIRRWGRGHSPRRHLCLRVTSLPSVNPHVIYLCDLLSSYAIRFWGYSDQSLKLISDLYVMVRWKCSSLFLLPVRTLLWRDA